MGTMNFSIPDDVKDKFNEVFKDDNKSAIVTELMRRAVEDRERKQRNGSIIERMRVIREKARPISDEEIRAIRDEMRK